MKSTRFTTFPTKTLIAVGAMTILAATLTILSAQQPGGGRGGSGRGGFGGGRGGGVAPALFTALDTDKDGSITRAEMKSVFDAWFTGWDTAKTGSLTQDQLVAGLSIVFPAPPAAPPTAAGAAGGFNPAGNTTPLTAKQADIDAMMAALPTDPGAKPKHPRKVLVFAHTGAGGFVHSSIPLAAKTVEALGNKGNLWTTTISYDPADINTANLKQYDLIFLDSTTGCFLDDPDAAVTAARRAAFLDFVRSGKGIGGIHAATDSYHSDCKAAFSGRGGGGGGRGGNATTLATLFMSQADGNGDQKLTRVELASLADAWFDKLDTDKTGKISQADFAMRFNGVMAPTGGGRGASGRGAGGGQAAVLQWPEFNKLIGGYFKFHWTYPQLITTKIDDPKSPLTAMFHGKEFDIHDETYTFAQDSFSRKNVHVLTSIDYDKMSAADKAKETNPRTDGDYGLSYIRREGKGRVFYEAHGHAEAVYAMTPMLEHIRAGIQYALGDIKADDSPSVK
jgi:type 1 glutamine amidotransferase